MNLVCFFFFFCVLSRNSRWPPKVAGKRFLRKVASRLCKYPVGQKFCRNRPISLRFQDKRIFLFNRNSRWPPKVTGKYFFCEIMPVDSADTLWVKNFVEIPLSRSVSEINTFLYFTQKYKMPAKSGRKTIFEKSRQ